MKITGKGGSFHPANMKQTYETRKRQHWRGFALRFISYHLWNKLRGLGILSRLGQHQANFAFAALVAVATDKQGKLPEPKMGL